ncbi:MAG TPA: hypothetical protein VNT52_15985, partial [Acidimicrobiales bacterium]|nr:hypothetical protein [Acidimicrobiales bacterium]
PCRGLFRYQPEAAAGPVLSFVGALGLLGSTIPRWFSVLVLYPTDQVLNDYGVLALNRGSLHSYIVLGWPFEVLTVLAGIVALVAATYSGVAVGRAKRAAVALIACGAVALGVVVIASITFEIANPRSEGLALGSDLRLGPGAIAAALCAVVILVGGLLTRRPVTLNG